MKKSSLLLVMTLLCLLLVPALSGCSGSATQFRMQDSSTLPSQPRQVTFPNGLVTGAGSQSQAASLAQILIQSHNMAVAQRERMERTGREGLDVSQRLLEAYERNQATAVQAFEMIRQKSASQGNSEITIFFPVNSSTIPPGSPEHDRLIRFADAMARESQGRTVHIVSVGSASATGPEAMNSRLAEERARAPIAVLDHYLVNVPHEYHNIYGTGDTYSPRSVSAQEHRRYQHVHLVAYFEGELSPSRQIPPQPATMPVLAATAAPIPKAPPVSGTFTSGAPGSRFTNMVGMDFVQLPPGVFTLGSPSSEYGHSEKERAHQVSLTKGFYIQTTEVTQGQWEAVMGENPSHFQICGSDCPVEQVSWFDVQRFIQRLNEMEQTRTYRLPTEAEWEYACRAGSSTAYANGGTIKDDTCGHNEALESLGWYFRNSELGTHPVARKQPNAWGLYDMHGNVWEWCRDWQAKYPFTPVTDPIGPEKGFHKIRRGGSWSHYPMYCRSAYRSWYDPDNRTAEIGFRLVRDLKEPPEPAPVRSMPAPQPARQPVDTPRVSEECIILHDVTFALDSAEIRPAMVPILDKVAQMLMTNPRRITLTGHTCSLATNKYNQRLSERRVETVRRELVRRGLDPSRITTGAMGETHPRYDNSTEAGRSLNRRVEIRIR